MTDLSYWGIARVDMDGIIELDPGVAKYCERIRMNWSDREREKRWKGPRPTKWSVPTASQDDVEDGEREAED